MKKLFIGAAYYPELWDVAEVDKDIERCKSLGLNVLRVGEFAWGKMEPREGVYSFDWLVYVVDKLYDAGIYTVMCTPTCTPPRYMLDKYEEMRNVSDRGVRSKTSWRCHPCKTSPIMREKNRAIVTQMAKVFGTHPGIIGWQIDNELYPYGGGCYCPLCVAGFRKYLEDKFGTVDALNEAWGMSRWSLDYQSFDAVDPPLPDQWKHPSLVKAWWDFQCYKIRTYVEEQAEILHKYTKAPIGTDMMANNNLSYYDITKPLDVVQFNHYNTADELYQTEFWYDFLRAVKDKPFWVTETQVGWNGSEFANCGYRPIGNCYVNTWLPFAHGANMNMYWLFRAHKNGHELAHGSLYSTAGREYHVSNEVRQAASEIDSCKDILAAGMHCEIALHYSSTAANTFAAAGMLKDFDYTATLRDKFYTALNHYNVDVIEIVHHICQYRVVISPFLCYANGDEFYERITEFVKNGGMWIVGPMTDIVDSNVTKYKDAPYSFLEQLVGVYTKYQKPIDNDVFRAKFIDGSPCGVSMCFDAYEVCDGTTSLAKYDGGEFDGLTVIAEKKIGMGKVILLGSVPTHADIKRLIGLEPIFNASDNVTLIRRDGKVKTVIAAEIENSIGFIELDGTYKDRISGDVLSGKITVAPYKVLVLEKTD
ncbi:MAG: beta-galactosidase [Clostridiales bacterium]|nr:beta-galactosidase [Clostridiales bacterium]